MVLSKETDVFRKDAKTQGKLLTVEQREKLLKPYLPTPPKATKSSAKPKPIRSFLETQLHLLIFSSIHTLFSLYIRLRKAYHAVFNQTLAILYYHHRTPELIQKDVRSLGRLPKHLSVILELQSEEKGGAGLVALLDEVAELSAWCASAGIPVLSIYEKTGILKSYIPASHRAVATKLHSYFGRRRPSLQIRAPHMPSFLNGDISEESEVLGSTGHLSILFVSAEDGRQTLVDLTKTLAEMAQRDKISPEDITVELVDVEITESVMGEPDLLLLFSPDIEFKGYPPWQLRLTEIFHVQDSSGVQYQVFLRALHSFAKAQMRFGR